MQKSIFIITDFKFKKNELVKIKSAFGKSKQYDHATFFNNEPQCLVENSTTNCLILNVLKKEQRGYISINLNNIKKNFILIIIMKSFQYSLLNNLGASNARIKRNELIDTKIEFIDNKLTILKPLPVPLSIFQKIIKFFLALLPVIGSKFREKLQSELSNK
jgi:hypothetical protein